MDKEKQIYINTTLKRIYNYYDKKIWDKGSYTQFQDWWEQFRSDEDKYLASIILNNFNYYSNDDIRVEIKFIFDLIIRDYLTDKLTENDPLLRDKEYVSLSKKFLKEVIIVPSYADNPTASSYLICRRVIEEMSLKDKNFCEVKELPDVIKRSRGFEPKAIIMIDDIIGSGRQAIKSWYITHSVVKDIDFSIAKLIETVDIRPYLACIAITQAGLNRLETHKKSHGDKGKSPIIINAELLDENSQFYHPESSISDDPNELAQLQEQLSNLCNKWSLMKKGFDGRSDLVAFYHDVPNITLPIIWCERNWNPLMKAAKSRKCHE